MNDKQIKITITARPQAGKSTIAVLIEKALRDAGFSDVILMEEEMTDKALANLRANVNERATAVATRNPSIFIHTAQASRIDEDLRKSLK